MTRKQLPERLSAVHSRKVARLLTFARLSRSMPATRPNRPPSRLQAILRLSLASPAVALCGVIFEPNSELPSICFRAHTPILVPMIAAASALAVLADGGLTLYIQHDSPGKDKESNWLPHRAGHS